jgi:tyrosyl-tRNA synthetase
VHGREAAERAAATAKTTFEEGALALSLPKVKVDAEDVAAGLGVLTAFVKAGLVASTGEARRQVKGGGLRVNDTAVTDERATLGDKDFEKDGVAKLSLGKKKHVLLERA